jgi:hypothetical protein
MKQKTKNKRPGYLRINEHHSPLMLVGGKGNVYSALLLTLPVTPVVKGDQTETGQLQNTKKVEFVQVIQA